MVLPLATTTKIHMTGSIRSWIHFLELRDDEHAQKEIQMVAKEIKKHFVKQFPIISKALEYETK
jgi:thymidylate synthase (FAD)